MTHQDWMKHAFEEAYQGMKQNKGGPFGAVVVLDGKIIGKGCNHVTSTNDPTAHAEIVAIRNACRKVKHFHLQRAVIYTTCEPCPMCLAAIYWANIESIYFCSTRKDAKRIGFGDDFIYEELKRDNKSRALPIKKIAISKGRELFNEWMKKNDKIPY